MGVIQPPKPPPRDPIEREKWYWDTRKELLEKQKKSIISGFKVQRITTFSIIAISLYWAVTAASFSWWMISAQIFNLSVQTFLYFFWRKKFDKFNSTYHKELYKIKFRIGND